VIAAFEAGREALRWVTDAAVAADGGLTWPETRAPGATLTDHLYSGTAGVLAALAEARLSGIADFDDHASAAAGRLRYLASVGSRAAAGETDDRPENPDLGLYTGLSGMAVALQMWASVSGDDEAASASRAVVAEIGGIAVSGRPLSAYRDLLAGNAGILLTLIEIGGAAVRPAVSAIADRIVSEAQWVDGQPDWLLCPGDPMFLPNFSHGAAGIGFALAAASTALDRPDLLEIAVLAGERLVRLGSGPDGTLAVPHSIPLADPDAPVSYGWCHGPTGTVRLFQLLDRLRPAQGWAGYAEASRRTVRASGLPTRLYPGFWDNLGQCCGTAGVGEMALDRYQESASAQWLAWARVLASDVLDRRIEDEEGIRWSHTEHRLDPPELAPELGWMQGAAGIAGWLLRLARVERDGVSARRLQWPDRVSNG
jgi:lantibiotic modifying enzyme